MNVVLGRAVFLTLDGALACVLTAYTWRRDRWLGVIVAVALAAYTLGGIAFGRYLLMAHGRQYFAPDEQVFQEQAQRMLEAWRSGTHYESTIADHWPHVNAAVLMLWGPSITPMRLLNALVGAASVSAAYFLAILVAGQVPVYGRAAAVFVLLSPSLGLWTFTNLKERALGLGVLLSLSATIALVQKWSWQHLLFLLAALWGIGELRHYYVAILGWLAITAIAVLEVTNVRDRFRHIVFLTLVVGILQLSITGTFLGLNTFHETVTKYVSEPAAGTSMLGETSGRPELVNAGARDVLHNLPKVVMGRFKARGDAGRLLAMATIPEWIGGLLLLPVVLWASFRALFSAPRFMLVPSAFLAGFALLLAYTYGDDWTTFRFRLIAWPVYLTVGAVGVVQLWYTSLARERESG